MVPRYDLAARSGVVIEFKDESSWERRRRRRWEMRYVCPQNREWELVVYFLLGAIAFCILFVRWWLCL